MTATAGGPERIGLFGGTFDPPHVGHVAAATACLEELGLDRVLVVVANEPWQKLPERRLTPAELRFEMVRAAVAGHPGLQASRLEIDRGGPSYTIDTVEELWAAAGSGPLPEVTVLVGSDLATTLPTWHRAGELARAVTLGVVVRPGSGPVAVPPGWCWRTVTGPQVDVSSSAIRARLTRGQPVDGLVPDAVIRCIGRHALYA